MERKFSLWMKLGEGIERIGVLLGDVALLLARSIISKVDYDSTAGMKIQEL